MNNLGTVNAMNNVVNRNFNNSGISPPLSKDEQRGNKREFEDDDIDSDEPTPKNEKRAGRRKIKIEYIEDKSRRHITFSKRKAGIMKKAYELSTLTGTQVLLLVVSETGLVYTFTTPKLQPLVTQPEGKNLIQSCLNAPDPAQAKDDNSSPQQSQPHTPQPSNIYGNENSPVDQGNDSIYGDDRKPAPHNAYNAALAGLTYGQQYGGIPSQMPGQLNTQMPNQLSSQMPSQMSNPMSNQMPNQMTSQMPNQLQSQLSSQMSNQMPLGAGSLNSGNYMNPGQYPQYNQQQPINPYAAQTNQYMQPNNYWSGSTNMGKIPQYPQGDKK
ncbi:transcription factor of the MADS box [Basidiobolus ranarum]|uniref:Transcription factor of the MADS box n=1 Tax=Basidiobolus ranarum TaxID=34480 RepID=A0ABR2WBR5_9FUNG